MWDPVWHTKPKKCNTLSSLLYRPYDDPVKGQNIVANTKYIHTW
jgi:hypothetical protein